MAFGGLEFSQIESALSNRTTVEDQLWDKALNDSRDRADKTVKKMGMKIDSIFAISPETFPAIETKIFGGERLIVTGSNIPTTRERIDPTHYRLEPISIAQAAHVIYLISPAK